MMGDMADMVNETKYRTGYFGVPGTIAKGKVHIIDESSKPVCGSVVGPKAEFQWCANGIFFSYVDCAHCQSWYNRIMYKEASEQAAKYAPKGIVDTRGAPGHCHACGQRLPLGKVKR